MSPFCPYVARQLNLRLFPALREKIAADKKETGRVCCVCCVCVNIDKGIEGTSHSPNSLVTDH